ncbi:flagellar protein FlaG [Paenibacillus sp. 1182]|uniref:flagellar protein FlaG n=1 Tax=Paenibacillus sp. 1182 TaxID=2806565 RepID=UPI000FA7C306|nr:flagellar protein FlaG [Paenibacillus sp. 1182]MBP1308046.1 flagellar protein FlaG [Paenibacillus sp. 1182]
MDNSISGLGPVPGQAKFIAPKGSADESSITAINQQNVNQSVERLSGEEEKALQQLEKSIRAVQGPEKKFEISIHKETHAIMIKVFDKQTGDLIREVPREKLLDVAASLMEINGLIIDKKA